MKTPRPVTVLMTNAVAAVIIAVASTSLCWLALTFPDTRNICEVALADIEAGIVKEDGDRSVFVYEVLGNTASVQIQPEQLKAAKIKRTYDVRCVLEEKISTKVFVAPGQ